MTPRRAAAEGGKNLQRGPFRAGRIALLASTIALAIGTMITVTAVRLTPSSGSDGCSNAPAPLRIAAAPEIADTLSAAIAITRGTAVACPQTVVSSSDAASIALAVRQRSGNRPDVWIPDSSLWEGRLRTMGETVPGGVSIAHSPLVLAVPSRIASSLGPNGKSLELAALLPKAADLAGPARWVLPSPEANAASVGALIGLKQEVSRRSDRDALLSTVIRASSADAIPLAALTTVSAQLTLPVSEQQVYAHNEADPGSYLVAAYPPPGGFAFDYPYITLTSDPTRRIAAARVLTALRSDVGTRLLALAGFRSVDGVAGTSLRNQAGIDASPARAGHVPDLHAVQMATDAYLQINRPTRLLAIIDTSGSMATPVPGAGGATRLDLALRASIAGLASYTDDNAIGLWTFTTHLTPTTDYQQSVPVLPLGRGPDGISGRARMVDALARTHVQKGRTGLYDTVLAGVREMRRSWDPTRVNSIVVITDGADSDPQSVGRLKLLELLRRENDPRRPVTVFAVAYGPTSDAMTLTEISRATGGRAYIAPDPRMIGAVLKDAIGRRACSADDC